MKQQKEPTGIPVFYSYASADNQWRDQLATHLSQLTHDGLIEEWHDQQILAGSDRTQVIDQAIRSAQIILLLISADFLASDVQYHSEMQQALERHKRAEACVIPIIVRPCDWQHSPFAHLQCLPRTGKPISTWDHTDEALLAVAQELRRIIVHQQVPSPLLSDVQRQNRMRMLRRVRSIWIEGLLEHSLHQAAWIDLHLREQPDALANPWRLQVQELNLEPHALPPNTSIVQVYDQAEGELLILGEPGAGKTTLLLHLTRALLDRAEADERVPMPVVFNLSSWADLRQPLVDWLTAELRTKYQIPKRVAAQWIESNQVLPLLDGLDEVSAEARMACVEAITTYYSHQSSQVAMPLVVCCRSLEYQALSLHLPLSRAVSILPLTKEQIDTYLSSAQRELAGIRQALDDDAELAVLAQRPLMLNIFTLAYQGATAEDFPTVSSSPEQTMRAAFSSYVERMLSRRGPLPPWMQKQFLRWLTFIARQLQQQQQTVFSVEDIRSDWLPGLPRRLYQLSARLLVGLLVGLFFALLTGFLFPVFRSLPYITDSPYLGNPYLQLCLLAVGLLQLVTVWFSVRRSSLPVVRFPQLTWASSLYTLFFMVEFFAVLVVFDQQDAVLFSAVFWVILMAVSMRLPTKSAEVIVWSISWSWKRARNGLIFGMFLGWVLGLILLLPYGLVIGLVGGPIVGLLIGLLFALNRGLSGNQLTGRVSSFPNEGIHRTGQTGLISGLILGLILGLIFSLPFGLPAGLLLGLSIGSVAGLTRGLDLFLTHFILRFFLWSFHYLPWKLIPFLDEAAERLFLRKVGGSYIFVHRMLLEYFASR